MKRISFLLVLIIIVFNACTKTEAPDPLYDITEVSGKVKQIVSTIPGSKIGTYTKVDYDASGRVVSFRSWTNDSTSGTPVVVQSDYYVFDYLGDDPKPRSSAHTNANGSVNEITYYTYDAYNRVIEEGLFRNGSLVASNDYNYLTKSFTRVTSSGLPFMPVTVDTAWTDDNRNILRIKTYTITNPATQPRSSNMSYDTKKNPLGETNIGIFIKTFAVLDNAVFFLTPNNLVSQEGNITGAPYNTAVYYNYSTNGFPVTSTLSSNLTSVYEYFD